MSRVQDGILRITGLPLRSLLLIGLLILIFRGGFTQISHHQAEPAGLAEKVMSLNQDRAEYAKRFEAIDKDKDLLNTQMTLALNRINALESDASVAKHRYMSAEFDLSDGNYQRVDANVGSFAVTVSDVRQFADGVKVTVKLGNLSSATFAGAKLQLRYGPRQPHVGEVNYSQRAAEWNRALQESEQSIANNLTPGTWNPIQVVLPRIEEKAFGYLEVKISTDRIALH